MPIPLTTTFQTIIASTDLEKRLRPATDPTRDCGTSTGVFEGPLTKAFPALCIPTALHRGPFSLDGPSGPRPTSVQPSPPTLPTLTESNTANQDQPSSNNGWLNVGFPIVIIAAIALVGWLVFFFAKRHNIRNRGPNDGDAVDLPFLPNNPPPPPRPAPGPVEYAPPCDGWIQMQAEEAAKKNATAGRGRPINENAGGDAGLANGAGSTDGPTKAASTDASPPKRKSTSASPTKRDVGTAEAPKMNKKAMRKAAKAAKVLGEDSIRPVPSEGPDMAPDPTTSGRGRFMSEPESPGGTTGGIIFDEGIWK